MDGTIRIAKINDGARRKAGMALLWQQSMSKLSGLRHLTRPRLARRAEQTTSFLIFCMPFSVFPSIVHNLLAGEAK